MTQDDESVCPETVASQLLAGEVRPGREKSKSVADWVKIRELQESETLLIKGNS